MLEMYQSSGGRTMYKLDGKRISLIDAEKAYFGGSQFIDNTTCAPIDEFKTLLNATIPAATADVKITAEENPVIVNYVNTTDRLAAINIIEENIAAPFMIDGKVKGCECVFAKNIYGDEMEMHDDFVKVIQWKNKVVTYFWLDVPESALIDALRKFSCQSIENGVINDFFTVTGKSGKVYTYDEKTLDVVNVDEPVDDAETEKVTLFKVLREKQKQLKKLMAENDVKSLISAKRFAAEISALAVHYKALKEKNASKDAQ